MTKPSVRVDFPGLQDEEYLLLSQIGQPMELLYNRVAEIATSQPSLGDGGWLKIAELGCGDGILTHFMLSRRGQLSITAVDLDAAAVALAQKRLQGWSQMQDYKVVQADALGYLESLSEGSLDVLASSYCLHNMLNTHRSRVLSAAFMALRPGGLFVNGDYYAEAGDEHHEALLAMLQELFDKLLAAGKPEMLRSWLFHLLGDQAPSKLMREQAAVQTMAAIGFVDVQIRHREMMEAILVARKPG